MRYRNFTAVVYPSEKWYRANCPEGKYDGSDGWGSAPDDWKKILDEKNLKWACSPIHDKDIDDDGKVKKPHWHIVVCYAGKKSIEQFIDDINELHSPTPLVCRNVASSVRYLIHKDHPHKYQYNQSDIESYGGFDVEDVFKFSVSETAHYTIEMADFIEQNNVTEFCDFDTFCRMEHPDTWYRILSEQKTMYFKTLIQSLRHKTYREMEQAEQEARK